MNNEKIPKPPTLLLLILFFLTCGLLLINTMNENVADGGLQSIHNKQVQQEETLNLIP